jgi:hypothetical protein
MPVPPARARCMQGPASAWPARSWLPEVLRVDAAGEGGDLRVERAHLAHWSGVADDCWVHIADARYAKLHLRPYMRREVAAVGVHRRD